jgi:hypothetical protein
MSTFWLAAAVLAVCVMTSPVQGPPAGGECLQYEPHEVSMTGKLVRRTDPGSPNYESVENGDQPETYFYLELSAPVCTLAASTDPNDPDVALHDVHLVQLVLDDAAYKRLRPKLGRRVTLRGTLFAAITGHHHAPLLLQVRKGS